MDRQPYEAPKVEVVGSISDMTQVSVKYRHHASDGIYLAHPKTHKAPTPLGS